MLVKSPEDYKQGFHVASVFHAARPDIRGSQNLDANIHYRHKLDALG